MRRPSVAHRRLMLPLILVAASADAPLVPSGKWTVDYAPHQCVAAREFGPPNNRVALVIKPSPTSDVVQLVLVKSGLTATAIQHAAKISIGASGPIKVRQLNYGTKKTAFRLVNLSPEIATTLGGADRIDWDGHGANVSLATGPLEKVMKTLADCRADLRGYWNIDPDKSAKLKSPLTTERPIVGYFRSEDYPRQAVKQDETGITSVVVLVDEKGAVRDCMVDGTSGIATLDAMTCIVVRERARFKPAVGEDGRPVRSYLMQRVRWLLP